MPEEGQSDVDMGRCHAEVLLNILRGDGFAKPNPRPIFANLPRVAIRRSISRIWRLTSNNCSGSTKIAGSRLLWDALVSRANIFSNSRDQ